MKRLLFIALSFCLSLGAAARVAAEDLSGRVGVRGIAQAAFPLGQESVKDQARDVGPDLGGLIQYGLSKHWAAGLSYENLDLGRGIRVEPIEVSAIHSCTPDKRWTPVESIGIGVGRGVDTKVFNDLTAKATLGVDYFVSPAIAVGPQVAYHYISDTGTESRRHAHVLSAGLIASYFFGGAPAAAKPAPAPVVAAPAAIGIVVNPANAVLTDGQTQALTANVSGTSNQAVTWSIAPALGTISNTGVYTAPASVALRQNVVATATSVADASKSASSTLTLQPAKAAEKVSISLNVLFDTAKAIVKPDYDAEIKKVADFMSTYTGTKAEIEGHTDNTGNAAYNETLSQQRADAVRQYLVDHFNIDASRLTAKGYGQNRPIADNTTKEGRTRNRRVIATLESVTK